MRRSLLPYALTSAIVVVASSGAIALSLGVAPSRSERAGPGAVPAAQQLAPDERLAYWRVGPAGKDLWVGDADGKRRWTIATVNEDAPISLTRWSPRGDDVAFVMAGSAVGIARLDGILQQLVLPADLVGAGWRIAGHERSPSGERIAVTMRPAGGASRESDVWVVAASGPCCRWDRLTTLSDAVAGRWIDDDRLFIETGSGMIAIADIETRALRPLTGMQAASPTIGRDGRVYVTGGQWVRGDLPGMPYGSGSVWSMTIDGDDLRKELPLEHDQMRLQVLLPDGRAVIGTPGSSYVAGDALVPMPWQAGTIRRVLGSHDGTRLIGITESRIVRLDAGQIPRSGHPPASAATVLLDGVSNADVWYARKAVALARGKAERDPIAPVATLTFMLGRGVWRTEPDGRTRLVSTAPADGWLGPSVPAPSGGRTATQMSHGGGPEYRTSVIVSDGQREWRVTVAGGARASWSPDGRHIAITTYPHDGRTPPSVQVYDAEGGAVGEPIDGMTGVWTERGLAVIGRGETDPGTQVRFAQPIEIVDGGRRTTLTDARRIAAHALLRDAPARALAPAISEIGVSGDGRYLSVWLARLAQSGGYNEPVWVVLRMSDGEPVWVLPHDIHRSPSDMAWSPGGAFLGFSHRPGVGPGSDAIASALVVDPVTGRTLLERPGRFGGWSSDGGWVYLARMDGLYAAKLDGSAEVRVSAIGVPVVATRP